MTTIYQVILLETKKRIDAQNAQIRIDGISPWQCPAITNSGKFKGKLCRNKLKGTNLYCGKHNSYQKEDASYYDEVKRPACAL